LIADLDALSLSLNSKILDFILIGSRINESHIWKLHHLFNIKLKVVEVPEMLWRVRQIQTIEYEKALAKGEIQKAQTIALQLANSYEEMADFKNAGIWYYALSWPLYYQGRYEESARVAEKAIQLQPDPYERALALTCLANLNTLMGRFNATFTCLGRAEEISYSLIQERVLLAKIYECKAFAFHKMGDLDRALFENKFSINLYLEDNLPAYAAVLINNDGFYSAKAQRLKLAESSVFQALDLIGKEPNFYCQAGILDTLGFIYTATGKYNEAEKLLNKALHSFEDLQNKVLAAGSLIHLSQLYDRMRRWKQARSEAERALQLATEINSESLCAEARNQLESIESTILKNPDRPRLFHGLLYLSNHMEKVISQLKKIAVTEEVVLLLGETGTGKELAARAIHEESRRRNKHFIPFNCSALSRELIESRLFGHRRGAFTGADRDQQGVIRAAAGGTIFLDEIGDLTLEAQGALLRFLQTGEIQPIGASTPFKIDVRVIAATNRDLRQEVEAGRFRRDLYYRLNIATLLLPPLRFRREDISALARYFAGLYSKQYGLPAVELSRAELAGLCEYEWPGNIRELEGIIMRRVLFGPEAFMAELAHTRNPLSWRKLREAEKRKLLFEALERNEGNVSATARQLGISRRAVQKILQRVKEQVS
jgi:transcriptional regulator with PAS, ATPase and Fis domain